MKRVLSIFLTVLMAISLLTTGVMAAEPNNPDGHIHVFDQKTLLTAPTCLTEGVVVMLCNGEGECELPGGVWSEPLPKVACAPMEERVGVREATCTQDGYTGDVRCKWCLSLLEEGEIIRALGHEPGNWVYDAWASDENIIVRRYFCTVCSELIATEEVIPEPGYIPDVLVPHTHAWNEVILETEATCQSEGIVVTRCTADGYCDVAGRTMTEVLPKAECCPTEERIGAVEATCVSEGRTGTQVCKWCMVVLEESQTIPKKEHVPADNAIGAVEATCVTEGRTGTVLCKNCLTVVEESTTVPKKEHTLGSWIEDALQSNDTVSVRHRFCTVCLQLIETEEIVYEQPISPFRDVDNDDYYFDSVLWAVEQGITAGTSATTFSPDKVITRAEVVTMLWRAAGSPAPKSIAHPFKDVPADAYYHTAVLWAVENGVTAGTDVEHFSPDALCTRSQVMTMLWRAKGSPLTNSNVELFLDVKDSDYFYLPVLWAVENGVTGGTGFFLFSPDAPCSRAQIVTFLYKAK